MTTIRTTIRTAVTAAATAGLAMTAMQHAGASTSHGFINHAAGNAAGQVWFNSGNHTAHSTYHPENGFNSFHLKDLFCGDGWGTGVEWQLNGETFTYRGSEDCAPDSAEVIYETDQASSIVTEFSWRPFMWAVDDLHTPEYGDWQSDWMGSNSVDTGDRYFTRTSVHNDKLVFDNEGSPHTFTASMWPTELARLNINATQAMWRDLQERTPLPPSLTDDERESLYKQLWCHATFARHPEVGGGDTWEIESARSNIPWWKVKLYLPKHECNWK